MGSSSSACSKPSVASTATRLLFSLVFIRRQSQFQRSSDAGLCVCNLRTDGMSSPHPNMNLSANQGGAPFRIRGFAQKGEIPLGARPRQATHIIMKETSPLSPKEMVDALNEDLAREFQAIIAYVNY